MVNLPAALQVVADLLSAAGCDGATPIAVPAHHYEEQEHVKGSNMPLAAALSKCYDLRSVHAVGGNEHQGIKARGDFATYALPMVLAVPGAALNLHIVCMHQRGVQRRWEMQHTTGSKIF